MLFLTLSLGVGCHIFPLTKFLISIPPGTSGKFLQQLEMVPELYDYCCMFPGEILLRLVFPFGDSWRGNSGLGRGSFLEDVFRHGRHVKGSLHIVSDMRKVYCLV